MSPLARDSQRQACLGIDPTAVVENQRLTNPGIDVLNRPHPHHLTDHPYIIYSDLRLSTASEPGKIP
jgi:hypothetical protein